MKRIGCAKNFKIFDRGNKKKIREIGRGGNRRKSNEDSDGRGAEEEKRTQDDRCCHSTRKIEAGKIESRRLKDLESVLSRHRDCRKRGESFTRHAFAT